MSESKFTPGPYLRDGACVYKLSKDGVNVFSAQVSSGYSDGGGRTSTEECEAVAQLMQVAPDMLEALEIVAKNCAADLTHSEADRIIGIARAAIARAKGEAQ
jgi:hypothetical protein